MEETHVQLMIGENTFAPKEFQSKLVLKIFIKVVSL